MKEPVQPTLKKLLPLLTSSLFARRQKFLILHPQNKYKWMFSNKPIADLIRTRILADATLHAVVFTNPIVLDMFYTRFPVLLEYPLVLQLDKINKVINRGGLDDTTTTIKVDKNIVFISYMDSDKAMKIPCGMVISDYDYAAVNDIIAFFCNQMDKTPSKQMTTIDGTILTKGTINRIRVVDQPVAEFATADTAYEAAYVVWLPMIDGFNHVSIVEYAKKSKLPYSLNIFSWRDQRALRALFHFSNDDLKVCSVIIAGQWFPVTETEEHQLHV